MSETLQKKSDDLKEKFLNLSKEERYQVLIDMGRSLEDYPDECKTRNHLVSGCQSILYLTGDFIDGKVFYRADGDALISKGLAALLISLYSGESPETILTSPPKVIEELGISSSLSLNRSNGFLHIHLRMKQIALETYSGLSRN